MIALSTPTGLAKFTASTTTLEWHAIFAQADRVVSDFRRRLVDIDLDLELQTAMLLARRPWKDRELAADKRPRRGPRAPMPPARPTAWATSLRAWV